MTRHRQARTIAVLAVTLALTSCSPQGAGMQPTITSRQAKERLQRYAHESAAALTPYTATLELTGGGNGDCSEPDDGGPKGRISPYYDYWINGIPTGANAAPLFDQMLSHWKGHGFALLHDDRPTSQDVTVENTTDGFRIGMRTSADGSIAFTVSAPCIWPNGTPEPTS